jgi:psiF repeat
MKRLYAAAILSLFAVGAYAQMQVKPEERVATFCAQQARAHGQSGDKRKAFIKSCTAKAPECVKKADEMKVSGMEYINSVAACVAK